MADPNFRPGGPPKFAGTRQKKTPSSTKGPGADYGSYPESRPRNPKPKADAKGDIKGKGKMTNKLNKKYTPRKGPK